VGPLVDEAGDVVGAPGGVEDDGAPVGPCEGWGLDGGRVVGLDVGCTPCGFGETPGLAWAFPFCHESATYPPAGTLSEVTPDEA
jgi:hypothetical protein